MATQYKLTYFPCQAMGEPIRFFLVIGKKDWADARFKRTDWPLVKPNTPFGQVPLLEFDGKTYWQSTSICRYLARELNLLGETSIDQLNADIIVDTISDFRIPLAKYFYEANPDIKNPLKKPLQEEIVPFYLTRFEAIAKENGGTFVKGQLTWADIYFAAISDYLQLMAGMDFFADNKYPNLKAIQTRIYSIPEIADWIAKRPANA